MSEKQDPTASSSQQIESEGEQATPISAQSEEASQPQAAGSPQASPLQPVSSVPPTQAGPATPISSKTQSSFINIKDEWMLIGTGITLIAMLFFGYEFYENKVKLLAIVYIGNSVCQMFLDYYKGDAKSHFSAFCRGIALLGALLSLLG